MINSAKIPKAYSEVYSFLNALGNYYISKIPSSVYNAIESNRDVDYNPQFTNTQKLADGMISHEGLSLISALNLQYWCDNDEEKEELKEIYINNTKEENKKYSYDNLFKNLNKTNQEVSQGNITTALVQYKESFFMKILNKIKQWFKR